jgi:uncharacterized protein
MLAKVERSMTMNCLPPPRSRSVRTVSSGAVALAFLSLSLAFSPANADQVTPQKTDAPSPCAGIGLVWWNELLAPETEKLGEFYGRVIGWSKKVVDVEQQIAPATTPEDKYTVFMRGNREAAGLMKVKHPEAPHSTVGWFVYIQVADVAASAALAQVGGGTVLQEPVELADGNTVAVVRDPMGNVFGLVTPANATRC